MSVFAFVNARAGGRGRSGSESEYPRGHGPKYWADCALDKHDLCLISLIKLLRTN